MRKVFLDFEYSTSTIGCCLFCQAPVGGNNRECITHGVDIICMDCARRIAALIPAVEQDAYVCEKCGRSFASKMGLVAHQREHKREGAEQ